MATEFLRTQMTGRGTDAEIMNTKREMLRQWFADNCGGGAIAVALSGGVDSAYLLYAAAEYAAKSPQALAGFPDNAPAIWAYSVRTQFQPAFEQADAAETVAEVECFIKQKTGSEGFHIEHRVTELDMLAIPEVVRNDVRRCYHCKHAMMSAIAAEAKGILLDGCNASDAADDRPGMQAAAELGVRSPLRECGISKTEVRQLAQEAGISIWNKPAYACLATRIEQGMTITAEKLEMTESAEAYLTALGFADFRVRIRALAQPATDPALAPRGATGGNSAALLQFTADQLPLAKSMQTQIETELLKHYSSVIIDPTARNTK